MAQNLGPCPFGDDSNARNLEKKSGSLAEAALGGLSRRNFGKADVAALFRNAFIAYTCFLMAGSMVYHALGGHFRSMDVFSGLGYLSTIAEAFGLLMLRRKIQRQESVSGISGVTIKMYAIVYALRAFMTMPALSLIALDDWAVKSLECAALVMVLDVLYSVCVTYRQSYEEEWDVLKLRYLVPGCLVLAVVLHPELREGQFGNISWTATLYLDVLALMPQVVMMSRGGGRVEAPISHFVAATAVSRSVDLAFWYYAFDTVGPVHAPSQQSHYVNYSGWLIVFFHVVHLALVADFLYYYVRARCFKGVGFSEDMNIPADGDDMI